MALTDPVSDETCGDVQTLRLGILSCLIVFCKGQAVQDQRSHLATFTLGGMLLDQALILCDGDMGQALVYCSSTINNNIALSLETYEEAQGEEPTPTCET